MKKNLGCFYPERVQINFLVKHQLQLLVNRHIAEKQHFDKTPKVILHHFADFFLQKDI
jgi:hypothetical protein